MSRPVKCPGCSLFFDRDKIAFVQFKNRYWHKQCYDSMTQQSAQDDRDLKVLEEYIVKLLKLDCMNARIKKQIKDMRSEYGFTYSGILKSLQYFYEVRNNSIEKANGGVGIVPYVYEDAKKYFYTIYMAQQQNVDKSAEQYVKKGKKIIIAPPERKVKVVELIDLEALFKEAEQDGE
jgi:hypothetical protein